jgi:hypothetical protein
MLLFLISSVHTISEVAFSYFVGIYNIVQYTDELAVYFIADRK